MVSDAASYDVGFDDADGFDFWGFFFFLRDNRIVMVGVEMVGLESSNPCFLDLFVSNKWLSLPALLCWRERESCVVPLSLSLLPSWIEEANLVTKGKERFTTVLNRLFFKISMLICPKLCWQLSDKVYKVAICAGKKCSLK